MSWIRKRSLSTRILHALLLSLVVALFAFFCPTPWALEAPGPFYATRGLVHIGGAETYESRGRFVLLTVVSEPASLLYCLYSFFDPAARLVPRSRPEPQAQAGDAWQMHLSQSVATNIALAYVMDQQPEFVKGLRVLQVMPGSPNQGLKPGDRVENLDGQPLHHVYDLGEILSKHKAGDSLEARLQRGPKEMAVPLKVWQNGPRKMIGAHFAPALGSPERPFSVQIDSEKVGGASGGLVFCLEIIDRLTPGDLTRGRVVAATGTLDLRGHIGAIEGIRYKLVGAQRAGAQLFLCPKANLPDLQGIDSPIPVVGVSNLEEAIAALQK
ncbi:MAG: PDZ domain-containing protein [Candidatus Eremiobacteraeota bacterium]|nr:PDZ domain-containing protein [Candidatus Eremiobacteraeota bacterium]MCW5868646.1 PDZ domain-containing protein [Candidatus Eremiobacteraeota bacterium]